MEELDKQIHEYIGLDNESVQWRNMTSFRSWVKST